MSKLNIYKSFNNIKSKKIISCVMAIELIASGFALSSCKKNADTNSSTVSDITSSSISENTEEPATILEEGIEDGIDISLKTEDELGVELSSLSDDSYYEVISTKNVSDSIVVIGDSAGKSVIVNKETKEYQIVDNSGKVISEGVLTQDGIPEGYYQIPGSEDLLPDGYEQAEKNYVGNDGQVVFEKGDVVVDGAKERLEKEVSEATTRIIVEEVTSSPSEIIDELVRQGVPESVAREIVLGKSEEPTTKVEESTTHVEETTTKVEESTTKAEESTTQVPKYKQYGFTSQEDYERWLAGEEYVLYNGVMVPYTPEFDNAETTTEYQKTLGGK